MTAHDVSGAGMAKAGCWARVARHAWKCRPVDTRDAVCSQVLGLSSPPVVHEAALPDGGDRLGALACRQDAGNLNRCSFADIQTLTYR